MIKNRWEHFPHEADLGIRGYGETAGDAFVQAAMALTAAITDPSTVRPRTPVQIHCQAADLELLLVDWLNELVYAMAIHRMLFCRFDVTLGESDLTATVWGEATDRVRHQPAVEVKGATYTALKVTRQADGTWMAQCVVDV